jgi:LPXTG-motif cell wall-anchored protein
MPCRIKQLCRNEGFSIFFVISNEERNLLKAIKISRLCLEMTKKIKFHVAPQSLSGGGKMNAVKIAAIVLILAGVLGLMYGGFSYTKATHKATLGPIELSVKDKQTVNVPVWAGVGAIVLGGALFLFRSKKS